MFESNYSVINKKAWTDFVIHHPNGNIFHIPEMINIYKKTPGYKPVFLACLDNSENIQGLVVGVIQGAISRLLRPFTARCIIWGGPLVINNSEIVTELLLKELEAIVSKETVYIQFRNLWNVKKLKPVFLKNNYQYDDHLDILIDLKKGEDLLWQKLHENRKKQIRRSIKRGCTVEIRDSLDTEILHKCYILLKETYNSIGLPYPAETFFQNAFQDFAIKKYIKVFLAVHNGEIIAFRFILTFKEMIYDWYAASDKNHHDKYANDLLPWEILRWGIANEYSVFDFGGAGKPNEKYGVRDYKVKFGGELVNYGRYNKINKPLVFRFGKRALKTLQIINSLIKG